MMSSLIRVNGPIRAAMFTRGFAAQVGAYNKVGSGLMPGEVNDDGSVVTAVGVAPETKTLTDTARRNIGTKWTNEEMQKWKDARIDSTDKFLKIMGHPVMERWEEPYMFKLAQIAASNGGRVLECGFGMAISATMLQGMSIQSHHIIEANKQQAEKARTFASMQSKETTIHEGFTWDVAPTLPAASYDGILYDTYPLQPSGVNMHQRDFFADAARLLKPGGVFTYFCNQESIIQDDEVALLKSVGFTSVKWEVVDVPTPDDCQYWRSKTIVAPICIK